MVRSGRRGAQSGTRELIRAAAQRQFAVQGFDRTSIRSVAREAGVDPGLVTYFFGSKHQLLVDVVQLPFDPAAVVEQAFGGAPADAGARLARIVAAILHNTEIAPRLVALARAAASDAAAAALIRDLIAEQMIGRVVAALGVDDAELRASLIGSHLVGLLMAKHVLGIEPLASLPPDALASALAPSLQHYLTGEL